LQRNPPGSALLGAHLARGKQRGLRKFAVSGKLIVAKRNGFPGNRTMQTRLLGGFCDSRFRVSRPRANGAVRAADSARSVIVARRRPLA
jgi:hypothetical protein